MTSGRPTGNKSFWMWAGVMALLAIGVVSALTMTGTLRFRGGEMPRAPIAQGGPGEAPRMLAPTDTEMPPDIRDWLEHLRITEEKRTKLAQDQIGSVMVSAEQIKGSELTDALSGLLGDGNEPEKTESPKVEETKNVLADVRPAWKDLDTFFNSKPPPDACREIASNYDQALRETGGTIGDIIDIMNSAADPHQAVAKLQEIMRTNKKLIDEPGRKTDQGVQAICDYYKTRKWFSISGDIGGGSGGFAVPSIGGG